MKTISFNHSKSNVMKSKYAILTLALGVTTVCCDEEHFREATMPQPIFDQELEFDQSSIDLYHPVDDFLPIDWHPTIQEPTQPKLEYTEPRWQESPVIKPLQPLEDFYAQQA